MRLRLKSLPPVFLLFLFFRPGLIVIPLDMLTTGEMAQVAEVGGSPAWVGRLAELGLREGCKLEVLQQGSTCLLRVEGCRLCLRPTDCSSILVQPLTVRTGGL